MIPDQVPSDPPPTLVSPATLTPADVRIFFDGDPLDFQPVKPTAADTSFAAFVEDILRQVCAELGIPRHLVAPPLKNLPVYTDGQES